MINLQRIESKIVFVICLAFSLYASLIFFAILGEIVIKALPSLTLYFILTPESAAPGIAGGVANAIAGTIILSLSATFIATPIALGTAIYLQKYAVNKKLASVIRLFLEVLAGTPSIVLGIFGLILLVITLKKYTGGFSLIAGAIALSILIMPVIERAVEEVLTKVPNLIEEGSYALGANKWQTIREITLPIAKGGILTGAILGFGRAAEESAVVVLTVGYSQFMPEFAIKSNQALIFNTKIYPLQDLVGTLPNAVYESYQLSHLVPLSNAFAIALVLILFVLFINIAAKLIFWHFTGGSKEAFKTLQKRYARWSASLPFEKQSNELVLSIPGAKSETRIPPFLVPGFLINKDQGKEEKLGLHSTQSKSDWRLALKKPVLPVSSYSKSLEHAASIAVSGMNEQNRKQNLPDLGRNEENRPIKLPWWKRLLRGNNDTSALGTLNNFDSSSLHTTSGISGSDRPVKSPVAGEKQSGTRLKEILSKDPKLASLIRKEQELNELFEDTVETQISKESKTILYTESQQPPKKATGENESPSAAFVRSGEEMNPYIFMRYSCTQEQFGVFEERPLDLPESNYSVQEHERWRLMHRNREENTFL